jgi:hypothetical protein
MCEDRPIQGRIVDHKKPKGPYENVLIARKAHRELMNVVATPATQGLLSSL